MEAATAQELCHSIRARVADKIGKNRYRTWFGDASEFNLDDHTLELTVANRFVGNWIASNYMTDIKEATRQVLGDQDAVCVRVVSGQAKSTPRAAPSKPASPPARPATRSRAPRPDLRGRFEQFVVGAGNRLAYSAADSIAREPGQAFKLLVLHGGCGLGKTHLLQGVCNEIRRLHAMLTWRYVSGEEFTNEFIYAVKSGRVDLFRARFRKVDILIIDDIHFLANKKATQEEFLHTFNAIDACGKAVVLSSDRHPRSIATLSEPLINRLVAGMVIEIEPPDYSTRYEILRRRAASMKIEIPDAVLETIARQVTRNVRELEGTLLKIAALGALTRTPPTLDAAQAVINEQFERGALRPDTVEIVQSVAQRFGVTREQVHSKSRDRTISLARAVAMFLVRKHTTMSFPEIGRAIGGKNHSTVVMATQRVERWLSGDAVVAWKTRAGAHESAIAGVIERLESELFPPRE